MPNKRDLSQELFGPATPQAATQPNPSPQSVPREVSLSELAELSELTEEQAKVRVKVTHLATQVDALTDGLAHSDQRLGKLKTALRTAVSQVERLSQADDLHSHQLGTLSDSLQAIEKQLEAHRNALAFLRNSDGQQQQSIERLKQSRITLTHLLLFGILLCAGAAFAFDVDKALNFNHRLTQLETLAYP